MIRRTWYETPRGWRYVDGPTTVGVGLDATTDVAAAVLPGGLPALGLYEAYKKLTGGSAPDSVEAMNTIAQQLAYLQAQVGMALPTCPSSAQVDYFPQIAAAQTAFTNSQQEYSATAEADRATAAASPETVKSLLSAIQGLQSVADKMIAEAGCATKPAISRWLCDDGTLAPGGDRTQCGKDWKKIGLWTAAGLGALVLGAVAYKAVSN